MGKFTLMDGRIVLSLVSVIAGWFLAQISGIVRDRLTRRRVRRCLLEELQELRIEFHRTLLIYARQLQIHALQGIDHDVPMPLSNHIFKNHYKEAVLSFNSSQRISYQMIHSYVETLNSGIEEAAQLLRELNAKLIKEGPASITPADGRLWGDGVRAGFVNTAIAIWHIDLHLKSPKAIDLTFSSNQHTEYRKYVQRVNDHISEILEAAKKLSRESFEKAYSPDETVAHLSNPASS